MADEQLPLYLLDRVYLPDRTLGSIFNPKGGIVCKVLELPWLNNARGKSCIPEGIYTVTLSGPVLKDDPNTEEDESGGRIPRPYSHYIVHGVKGRSGILIHRGTDVNHSRGCLLVASRFTDINTDQPKLEDSATKLAWMVDNIDKKFRLLIEAKSGKPYT